MALQNILKLVTGAALKKRSWQDICHDLLRLKDEATVLRLAAELLDRYSAFDEAGQIEFFEYLLTEFRIDQETLRQAIDAYLADTSPLNVQSINRASLPSRRKLFETLNMCPDGTQALLGMRAALIKYRKENPELGAVASDLEILFGNWFNRGFLTLERIDWSTPAHVLEKLFKYEAVHEILGWDDLKRRVSSGRRCYAFFHPALPHEPIIFVQVALAQGLISSIADVIGEDVVQRAEDKADTAIFYSISNCQQGLLGIAFGDLLIKQVAELISADLPQVKTFATLSPVPGFNLWLRRMLDENDALIEDKVRDIVEGSVSIGSWVVENDTPDVRSTLESLCAHYLVEVKRNDLPIDPVARFHLRNGARLERINWLGDQSPKGLQESSGFMVNYVYDLSSVTKNHETYVYDHGIVCSNAIKQHAKRVG